MKASLRWISDLLGTPLDAREAALVVTLPAGAYTAIVENTDGTPGVGIVEVYRVN